jgi:hypothetical protein
MKLPGYPAPYSENPGVPTDEEWGVYCPHGRKIVEALPSPTGDRTGAVVDPWPCARVGCTPEAFEQELINAELDSGEPMWPEG